MIHINQVFEDDDVFPDRWRDLHEGLKAVKHHICIPTGLSSGQRSIPHKAAAMVHALAMELSSTDQMYAMLRSFKSYTSDMGTELSLPDFRVQRADSLLPEWLLSSELQPDVERASSCSSRELCPDVMDASSSELVSDVEEWGRSRARRSRRSGGR